MRFTTYLVNYALLSAFRVGLSISGLPFCPFILIQQHPTNTALLIIVDTWKKIGLGMQPAGV